MAAPVIEIVKLFVGRGLRAEPFNGLSTDPLEGDVTDKEPKRELSVDLSALQVDLAAILAVYEAAPGRVWMPLTTVVGGTPELVWEDDSGLIPTQVTVEEAPE